MKATILCLFLVACAGPTRKQLAETPTATTRRPPTLAPPASDSDQDRYRVNQQFEDQRDAEQAYDQAGKAERSRVPPAPLTPEPAPPPPDPPDDANQ